MADSLTILGSSAIQAGPSLKVLGVLLRDLRQLVALNNLEASVSAEDLIEGVSDALLGQAVLRLQESLLLAWVEHDDSWHLSVLEVESGSEVRLLAYVQAHEVECDATLNLAFKHILHIAHGSDDTLVT